MGNAGRRAHSPRGLGHDSARHGDAPHAGESSPLARAVTTALSMLGDLSDLHDAVRDGRVEFWLRSAVRGCAAAPARTGDRSTAAVPAVRAACAHLGAGELEDAYLALLTARDLLGLP